MAGPGKALGRRSSLRLVVAFLVLAVQAAPGTPPTASARATVEPTGVTEQPVRFRSGAERLFGVLALPAGGARHAAVVLLSGSERGGADMAVYVEHARTLARSGLAVLRYDPPGVGRSTGARRLETLDGRAREALAAVDYLRSRPEIRPDRIGLWGISQGGWVTQMAAARSRHVAFVVSVSGSGVSVAEQQVYSVEAQSRAALFSPVELARAGVFARMLVDWQLSRPLYRAQSRALLGRLGPGPWRTFAALVYEPGDITPAAGLKRGIAVLRSIRHEPWAAYLYLDTAVLPALESIPPARAAAARRAAETSLLVEPARYLRSVRCPVLGIWGADDVLVPARTSAAIYRKSLAAAHNPDVTLVVFADAGHSIDDFAPRYWKTLTAWLRERFAG